ncbi:gamma-glutamylcyclotransferase [Klebsiella pneumoniae subsp. pneumoniae]|nr:gamma-glutamylcyclotransferase [Klebsiella pneumoniae subsp. pneumoniae]
MATVRLSGTRRSLSRVLHRHAAGLAPRVCLRLTAGRGSACQPGRMLALKEGGRTTGVAYRLPDDTLEEELTLLWKREMITGCHICPPGASWSWTTDGR